VQGCDPVAGQQPLLSGREKLRATRWRLGRADWAARLVGSRRPLLQADSTWREPSPAEGSLGLPASAAEGGKQGQESGQ
jgi:hypothetical protein